MQVSAALPDNFIAIEYPTGDPEWWYDIVDGLPDPVVKDGMIAVWDRPGMGIDINPERRGAIWPRRTRHSSIDASDP